MLVINTIKDKKVKYLCDTINDLGAGVKHDEVEIMSVSGTNLGRLVFDDGKWYWKVFNEPRTYHVSQFDTRIYKNVKIIESIELIDKRNGKNR